MITSASNPKIKQICQWQAKARERRRDGVFVVEGVRMVQEAPLGALREICLTETILEKNKENAELQDRLRAVPTELVSEDVFRRMSDTQTPQGILAVVRQAHYELAELLSAPCPLLVILEDLQDPGNLGTILRTGEGAGITGVIMSRGTVDIYNPKVIRSTMGSIYRVPFVYADDLTEVLRQLRAAGIRTYAAHLRGTGSYDTFSYREPTAFLIGNEGNGLSRELADAADTYLRIPMEGQVESLNAAVASALLLYEAHRQRNRKSISKMAEYAI